MTLEELKVLISAETKGYRDEITKIKNQTKQATSQITAETGKIKSSFRSIGKVIAGLAIGASIIKIGKDAVKMAMSVEASIQQVNRLMGDNANKFKQWAKSNALAFNMSQSDALRFGSVYSNLLTSFMDTSDDVFGGTMQLLKASSVIASGTGRTMEDVMERIRSGLLGNTEAIEDLGVDVRVGMLESTNAFKRFAGDSSWDQLDTKTQQQIRLFAILEQTTQKFGDSVLVNANSSMQQLVAILKDVSLNIGNAFMPIVNIVMPILTGFAMKLREATAYLSTFMSLLFGKKQTASPMAKASQETSSALGNAVSSAKGLSSGLGKAASNAKKTAKELGGIASFDDLNILSAPSNSEGGAGSSGGSGGINTSGGGLDWGDDTGEPSIPEIDTSGIQNAVDKVKKMFGDMKKLIVNNKTSIISALAGIVAGFTSFNVITKLIPSISAFIKGIQPLNIFFGSWLASGGGVANFFSILGAGIGAAITPAVVIATAIAAITAALVYLYQTSRQFREIVNEAFSSFMGIVSNLYNNILVPLFGLLNDIFVTVLVPIGAFLVDVFVVAVDLVASTILSWWDNVMAPFANFLVTQFSIILQGVIDVWNAWKPGIELIMSVVGKIWDSVLKPFVEFIKNTFIAIFETFGDVIDELLPHVQTMFQGLVDFFVGVFTIDIDKCWEGIKGIFSGAWEAIKVVFEPVSNFFGGIWKGIQDAFGHVTSWFRGVFTDAWTAVKNVFSTGGKIFDGIKEGIAGVFTTVVNGIITGVNKVIAVPFKSINGILNEIRVIDIPLIGKPFKGLWGKNPLPVPQIPYMRNGGVLAKGQTGYLEGDGTEAVVPLEKNVGWTRRIADLMVGHLGGFNEGQGGTYEFYFVMDGDVLFKKVVKNIKDYEKRTGSPVFG